MSIQQILITAVVLLLPSTIHSQAIQVSADTSLVDLSLPAAVDSTNRWQYRESTTYDLNGDGIEEKVVILANVQKSSSGNIAWDDGQPWEVRIEEPDGTRTRVFAQSVQAGTVQGYITHQDGHPTLFLLEQTTSLLQGFEITYFGPNKIKSRVIFTRTIDRFVKKTDGPR
jgi:hypothetical protein